METHARIFVGPDHSVIWSFGRSAVGIRIPHHATRLATRVRWRATSRVLRSVFCVREFALGMFAFYVVRRELMSWAGGVVALVFWR